MYRSAKITIGDQRFVYRTLSLFGLYSFSWLRAVK